MITLFAIPKEFKGHIGLIQENAIKSWTQLKPKSEIFLCGDEKGTKEYSNKFKLHTIPLIKRNKYGTPLLNDLFNKIKSHSKNSYFGYINADIIVTSSFSEIFESVKNKFEEFLIVGKRFDLAITNKINYSHTSWDKVLKKKCQNEGELGGNGWIDYFIFTRNAFGDIPPFAIGRTFLDKWLIWNALKRNIPVIDATDGILAIHQSHKYTHVIGGSKEIWMGKEALENIQLAGGWTHSASILESQYVIKNNSLMKQNIFKTKLIKLINTFKAIFDIPRLYPILFWIRESLNNKKSS
jgi:hypothetical protein